MKADAWCVKAGVWSASVPARYSAPLMSSVAGLRPAPPSLLRYAEHPTGTLGKRRGGSTAANHRCTWPWVTGGRHSEVEGEGRAQPGPEDMSSVGHPSPMARSDINRAKRFIHRGQPEARQSN